MSENSARESLRKAIEEEHVLLHAAVDRARSVDSNWYLSHLDFLYRVIYPIEMATRRTRLPWLADYAPKGTLIAEDLRAAGRSLPTCDVLALASEPEILGAVYVVEGSMRGRKEIARWAPTPPGGFLTFRNPVDCFQQLIARLSQLDAPSRRTVEDTARHIMRLLLDHYRADRTRLRADPFF